MIAFFLYKDGRRRWVPIPDSDMPLVRLPPDLDTEPNGQCVRFDTFHRREAFIGRHVWFEYHEDGCICPICEGKFVDLPAGLKEALCRIGVIDPSTMKPVELDEMSVSCTHTSRTKFCGIVFPTL